GVFGFPNDLMVSYFLFIHSKRHGLAAGRSRVIIGLRRRAFFAPVSSRRTARGRTAFSLAAAVEKLKALDGHRQFAALLAFLRFPLLITQATFDQQRPALLHVLVQRLRLTAEARAID